MQYYRARYYDPKIGRFAAEDPIQWLGRSINFYPYVNNNPVNLADPFGLTPSDGCCKQDYPTCVAVCIEYWDPLNPLGKVIATAGGGTVPIPTAGKTGGGVPRTTIPSLAVHAARRAGVSVPGKVARGIRGIGDKLSFAWIVYGDYLFLVEVHCFAACAGYACSY